MTTETPQHRRTAESITLKSRQGSLGELIASSEPALRVWITPIPSSIFHRYQLKLQQNVLVRNKSYSGMQWQDAPVNWGTKPKRYTMTRRRARDLARKMLIEAYNTWDSRPQ